MKKIVLSLSVLALLAACNNASENDTATTEDTAGMAISSGPTDTAQARKDLTTMLDSMHSAFVRKDPSYVDRYMTQDGIYMGTDPGEIYDFNGFRDFAARSFQDTTIKSWQLNVSQRIIQIHGASANLVEQYTAPGLTGKLIFRNVGHARYENGRWMMDMLTYNVIPRNEDIPKIDQAL